MPTHQHVQTRNFRRISPTHGIFIATMDVLPPTVCPDYIPAGWELALDESGDPEVLEVTIGGEPVELYMMQQVPT